jgi:hypothetical protein
LYFESYRVAVGSKAIAVSSKLMVEATTSSHLGEVVGKAATVVLAVHGEGPADDGGREGKTIPAIGALGTPLSF